MNTKDRKPITSNTGSLGLAQLLDLSGRNRMLYYRDLSRGTLKLVAPDSGGAWRSLLGGEATELTALAEDRSDAPNRSDTIWRRARENLQEEGISTLYLVLGAVTWRHARSGSDPNAPVLLIPGSLERNPAGDDLLTLAGLPEFNPALRLLLEQDLDLRLTPELLEEVERPLEDPSAVYQRFDLVEEALASLPDFSCDRAFAVLGNFSYEKMPMVADLEQNADAIAAHRLIAALMGDDAAQASLRQESAPESQRNHAAARIMDLLPRDADPSQRSAIARVVAGDSVVIDGPPGTGKSQTIANLMAVLAAEGKSVLFVASKRAAIDAVTTRLASVGLDEIVLDLHGSRVTRRRLYERLGEALDSSSDEVTPVPELPPDPSDDLTRYRDRLHRHRESWGLSVFEAVSIVAASPYQLGAIPDGVGLDLTAAKVDRLSRSIEEWYGLRAAAEGIRGIASTSDADRLLGLLDRLTERVESIRPMAEIGEAWWDTVTIVALAAITTSARSASRLLESYDGRLFDSDLEGLLEACESPGFEAFSRTEAALDDLSSSGGRRSRSELADDLRAAITTKETLQEFGILASDRQGVEALASWVEPVRAIEELIADLASFVDLRAKPVASLVIELERLAEKREAIRTVPRLLQLEKELTEADLDGFLRELTAMPRDHDDVSSIVRGSLMRAMLRQMLSDDEVLGASDFDLTRAAAELADHTSLRQAAAPQRVRERVRANLETLITEEPGQHTKLLLEVRKSRGHRPLREVFPEVRHLLLALRPCWTMSPLMVSQLLPGIPEMFDVVIFDEASQVMPADAVPALYRAKQAVIAGDRRQLPPTTFFMSGYGEDDEVDDTALGLDAGYDSILDLLSAILPEAPLEWHYRSTDDRLIAFSNERFYSGRLTSFPSPSRQSPIEHIRIDTPAPDERRWSNPAEVEEVAAIVERELAERPDHTLGVVALGLRHADELTRAVERVLKGAAVAGHLDDEPGSEPLFVKNLERVQGDERDTIIVSLGYSPGSDGRLSHNFGPINQTGGERRLNVAITRARRRLVVVSSFGSEDIDLERSDSRGVQVLKEYLAYAERGGDEFEPSGLDSTVTDDHRRLLRAVCERLRDEGLIVQELYGKSDAAIDLAIAPPESPARLILAVDTDGPRHSHLTTPYDRDVLRPTVLESMGWRFHRLSALDWLTDADREVGRIVELLGDMHE